MPGLIDWPPLWPEFTSKDDANDSYQIELKHQIAAHYGEEAIRSSWLKVCKKLESVTHDIAARGTKCIPDVSFEKFMEMTGEEKEVLKERGCFVIRNVIPREQAEGWFSDLKRLVKENNGKITGWPKETPSILRLYYSPVQVAARSHPNQLAVQRHLNNLWHGYSGQKSSPDPLTYCDGARIRPPKVPFLGLGPHIDAGSLCRWADGKYLGFYDKVFLGMPGELDMYDMGKREEADHAFFEGAAQSTVLRSFQGWTALTKAGAKEGSLLLYPDVKTSIAYVLLRPFFKEPADPNEIVDASKWEFDISSSWFPGTFRDDSQLASPSSHPHLRLKECMVNIPTMYPGDTVWWHTDMLHAVEVEHSGTNDASVVYIASVPKTRINKKYIMEQLQSYLNGMPPPDFAHDNSIDERDLKGFLGDEAFCGEEGRRAFGFGL